MQAKKLDEYWRSHSKSYRIYFYTTIEQVTRVTFDLDEVKNPPYDDWSNYDDEMKIKKWMLAHAIDRANNMLSEESVYIKDNGNYTTGSN